jgi:hypothetical protein
MGYDENLANRIRELIAGEPDVSEQDMFGGLVFLIGGYMSVRIRQPGIPDRPGRYPRHR